MTPPPGRPGDVYIAQDQVPALRIIAQGLSERLGRQLNYAHAYVAILSAEQSGALPITVQQWLQNPGNQAMIDTVANLLKQDTLLDELLEESGLKDADKGGRKW